MRAGTREVWWDCVQSIPCHTWGKLCTRGLSHSAVPLSQLRLAGLAQSINQLTNPELHLKGWDLMGEKAASRLITPFNLIPWTSRKQRRWEKETPKFPKWFITNSSQCCMEELQGGCSQQHRPGFASTAASWEIPQSQAHAFCHCRSASAVSPCWHLWLHRLKAAQLLQPVFETFLLRLL